MIKIIDNSDKLKDEVKIKNVIFFNTKETYLIAKAFLNNEKYLSESKYNKLIPIQAFYTENKIIIAYEFLPLNINEDFFEYTYFDENSVSVTDSIMFDLPEHKLTPKRALKQFLGIDVYTKKYLLSIFRKLNMQQVY